MNFEVLNKKEAKKILELIKKQWDADFVTDKIFLKNQNDIFLVNRDVFSINLDTIRINSLGLYFGELFDYKLRLSIEGSQLIGPIAKENVVEINENELRQWLRGENIIKQTNANSYVIIKHSNDFFGCGKAKENLILNYVPKVRRISELAVWPHP
jgi:NOL1/NOP2/fmu family ribosome biogenesis protein